MKTNDLSKEKSIYEWKLPTMNLWAAFEYGEVEAHSKDEAKEKAERQLKSDIERINIAIKALDNSDLLRIEANYDNIEIELKKDREERTNF